MYKVGHIYFLAGFPLLNVRVRLQSFYLILHNLFHSFIYNPVACESCIHSILVLLYHSTLTTHVQPVHVVSSI